MPWWLQILHPRFWNMNACYSREWDRELNRVMGDGRFSLTDKYTAEIGGHTVWVSNYPYDSFVLPVGGVPVRPSRRTILRARSKLIDDIIFANTSKHERR